MALANAGTETQDQLDEGIDFARNASLKGRLPNSAAETWTAGVGAALITDTGMNAGAVRSPVRMPQGSTCFAFISTSNGSCTVSLLPTK